MKIEYRENPLIFSILMQYIVLIFVLFVLIKVYNLSNITVIGSMILVFVMEYLYFRTLSKVNTILKYKMQKVEILKVSFMGEEEFKSSAYIEYLEFKNDNKLCKAINLETFFFPILKARKNIVEEGIFLDRGYLENIEVYINPNTKGHCYFNDDITHHKSVLKKVHIATLLILAIPIFNAMFMWVF